MTPATLSHSFSNSGEDSIYAVRHLRKILENAVLTHAEPSRKANDNSTGVYTLFGAVRTETGIQPVKLKVKEYRNVGQDIPEAVRAYFERNGTQEEYSRAYDSRVLSLESIEKEEPSSSAFTSTPNGAVEYPSSSSTIRVQDLLRLVNSRYRKYVPTFSEMEKELSPGRSIDELAQISVRGKENTPDYNARHGAMAADGWNYRTAYFRDFDGRHYKVTISTALNPDGKIVYNIGKMQERSIPQISGPSGNSGAQRGDASANSIPTSDGNVNTEKFSTARPTHIKRACGIASQTLLLYMYDAVLRRWLTSRRRCRSDRPCCRCSGPDSRRWYSAPPPWARPRPRNRSGASPWCHRRT